MKIQCNKCESEKLRLLIPNFYECRNCGNIFSSIKNSGLLINTEETTTIEVVNLGTRKPITPPMPGIIVGIDNMGVNHQFLGAQIMGNSALTDIQKNDIREGLGIDFNKP